MIRTWLYGDGYDVGAVMSPVLLCPQGKKSGTAYIVDLYTLFTYLFFVLRRVGNFFNT